MICNQSHNDATQRTNQIRNQNLKREFRPRKERQQKKKKSTQKKNSERRFIWRFEPNYSLGKVKYTEKG